MTRRKQLSNDSEEEGKARAEKTVGATAWR